MALNFLFITADDLNYNTVGCFGNPVDNITPNLDRLVSEGICFNNAHVFGRKGFATRGKEHEGRLSYERVIFETLSTFKDARSTADPQVMFLVEYTFCL